LRSRLIWAERPCGDPFKVDSRRTKGRGISGAVGVLIGFLCTPGALIAGPNPGKRDTPNGPLRHPQERLAVALSNGSGCVSVDGVDHAFLDGDIPSEGPEEAAPSVIGVFPEAATDLDPKRVHPSGGSRRDPSPGDARVETLQ